MKRRLCFLVAAALFFGAHAFATIAIVQTAENDSSVGTCTTTSCAVTLAAAVTSGNTVVYAAECVGDATSAFTSIADDKTDTFPAPDVNANPNNGAVIIGHLSNVTSAPTTFTITLVNCSWIANMRVWELSAVAASPVDVHVDTNIAFTTPPITYAYTTAAANEFAVSLEVSSSTAITSITGWTIDDNISGKDVVVAHLLSPSSGSNTLTINAGASTAVMVGLATYEEAGGSPTCTHDGITSGGALAVPNGTTGSYQGKSGAFVTPDCSTVNYKQPTVGNFGTN